MYLRGVAMVRNLLVGAAVSVFVAAAMAIVVAIAITIAKAHIWILG